MGKRTKSILSLLILIAVVAVWKAPEVFSPSEAPAPGASTGEAAVLDAFRARRSGDVVEVAGAVSRLLPDDREGSRHQRLILRLASGHTVLIAHNIDLAPRVPVKEGESIELRGQYEWNERGGVIHWTHHDPKGRRPGGWIRHAGQTYE